MFTLRVRRKSYITETIAAKGLKLHIKQKLTHTKDIKIVQRSSAHHIQVQTTCRELLHLWSLKKLNKGHSPVVGLHSSSTSAEHINLTIGSLNFWYTHKTGPIVWSVLLSGLAVGAIKPPHLYRPVEWTW